MSMIYFITKTTTFQEVKNFQKNLKTAKFVVLLLFFICYGKCEVIALLVLIIDQDTEHLKKTETVLKRNGMKVAVFQDAMAAVQYGYNHTVDVVYTEVAMPHISGCDVIKLLKQRHPAIKAYFLTQGAEYLAVAKQHRIDGYFVKPFRGDLQNENLLIKSSC